MKEIAVYRYSPYVIEKKFASIQDAQKSSVSSQELRSWIKTGKIFSHLFRYRKATMECYDLRLIAKPFASAILMKLLSWRNCIRVDRNGVSQQITVRLLTLLLGKLLKDFLKKRQLVNNIQTEVDILIKSPKKKYILNLKRPPVYLRSDLFFGLESGGSIGHIAGVLNNLKKYSSDPIFISTDHIPTVSKDCETHIVLPENAFWDFSELPPLYFNEAFYQAALKAIDKRKPSFIYQRYNLNNFSGVRLARHFQVPFVLEFNGSEIWVSRNWGNHTLKYEKLAQDIEYLNLKASDLVVVVSKPLKDQLVDKGIPPEKILVNPNGVDPKKYSPSVDGGTVREKHELQKKIVLGFIGTFGMWHGAEVLAKAFVLLLKRFPELKNSTALMMIGDGVMMPDVKKILSSCMQNCILTGTIPQELGPSYLAACDILISPHVPNADGSAFFGSPTKLFEYMAMGKGIVASDLDQIGEILEHNLTAYMVKPGDVESLMQGMKVLIDDPSLRKRLGDAARKDACLKHTWEMHTRKIFDFLQ